jgi:hypothetical protein
MMSARLRSTSVLRAAVTGWPGSGVSRISKARRAAAEPSALAWNSALALRSGR